MLIMKKILIKTIISIISFCGKTRFGQFLKEQIVVSVMDSYKVVNYNGHCFLFTTPNRLSEYRAVSFADKEPETLEWIDNIPDESVIWDIGANVGLYSVYAAKTKNCRVFAFEPSVFNIELLSRNIYLNQLSDRIIIVPLPLSDGTKVSHMNFSTMEWSGALSTFEKDYGWDGNKLNVSFDYQTVGISMDEVNLHLGIPIPDYIKLDVDGIEHLILKGGHDVLKKIKGLIIEVNDNFREQAELCRALLESSGLSLIEKRHSAIFDDMDSFGNGMVWNQIWSRR
jgi:FkbM family methyltransferase